MKPRKGEQPHAGVQISSQSMTSPSWLPVFFFSSASSSSMPIPHIDASLR